VRPRAKTSTVEKRQKATTDKESQRWFDTLTAAEQGLDESVYMVHVGDREADIYFVHPRRVNDPCGS
jgi:hypothetical protein